MSIISWLCLSSVGKEPSSYQAKDVGGAPAYGYPSDRAYVCLAANDRAVFPTLVLFHQLNSLQSKAEFVCLITERVSPSFREIMRDLGIKVRLIPNEERARFKYQVGSRTTRMRDEMLWNKLYAWNLVEYEKIVLLDNDLLILENIDELFNFPSVSGVPALFEDEKVVFWEPPSPYSHDPSSTGFWTKFQKVSQVRPLETGLNSGVFVMTPDKNIFEDMLSQLLKMEERTCCPTQEFIFRYFEVRGQYNRIPAIYNARKLDQLPADLRNTILAGLKVYHFVERFKPINKGKMKSLGKFDSLWWKAANAFEADLASRFRTANETMIQLIHLRDDAMKQ